jgi:YfiH family protein
VFSYRDACDPDPASPRGSRVEVVVTDATIDAQGLAPGFADVLAGLEEATGVPLARLTQVHGDEVVHVVDEPPRGPSDDVPVADAMVTARRGVGLMVRVADCVPVVLADPDAGVVGVAHAGRAGTALDVVGRTTQQMRELGAEQVRAWVGPHVCGRCYEVPAAMRDEVAARVPATWSQTSWGTPALDLGAGVVAQLHAAGVAASAVHDVGRCTLEDVALHSHRRDGAAAGRLAAIVWMP